MQLQSTLICATLLSTILVGCGESKEQSFTNTHIKNIESFEQNLSPDAKRWVYSEIPAIAITNTKNTPTFTLENINQICTNLNVFVPALDSMAMALNATDPFIAFTSVEQKESIEMGKNVLPELQEFAKNTQKNCDNYEGL